MKSVSKKKNFLIIGILGILSILSLNVFQKEVRNFFYLISSPIQKVLWQAGRNSSDFFESFLKTSYLKKENEDLKLRNQELLQKIVELQDLKKENEFLREALKIGLEKDFKLVISEIIGKDIAQDFILVNKGSENNISKGSAVITAQKILVGKIEEVYKGFSKVILVSNRKSSFDAKIVNPEEDEEKNEVTGIVKGEGNLNFYIGLIPLDKEISPGEIVVTSHLGGIFPANLLVGQIKKVKKSDIEPFQQAEITSAFDIRELENLFIITEY